MVLRERDRGQRRREEEIFVCLTPTYRLFRQSLVPVLGRVGGAADCPQLPLTGQDLLSQHTDLLKHNTRLISDQAIQI